MPDMQTATIEHFDAEIAKFEAAHTASITRLKEAETLRAKANQVVADMQIQVDAVGSRLDSLRANRYLLLSQTRRKSIEVGVSGELLVRAREAGLKQTDIADRMGITLARYKSLISGKTQLPEGFVCRLTQVIEAAEATKEAHVG